MTNPSWSLLTSADHKGELTRCHDSIVNHIAVMLQMSGDPTLELQVHDAARDFLAHTMVVPGTDGAQKVEPDLVFRDGDMRLAIGAPGGTQIAMGVMQATLNVLDHGMTMTEAVAAPRFSATSDIIDVTNRIPRYVQRELEGKAMRWCATR